MPITYTYTHEKIYFNSKIFLVNVVVARTVLKYRQDNFKNIHTNLEREIRERKSERKYSHLTKGEREKGENRRGWRRDRFFPIVYFTDGGDTSLDRICTLFFYTDNFFASSFSFSWYFFSTLRLKDFIWAIIFHKET